MSPQTPQSAADRLSRLLAMVPYLLDRRGIELDEAARHFGLSESELVDDLQLLFVCGLPGHLPDDLIEAEWESGHIYLGNADALARPLRLGMDEAVALLAGLRTLAEAAGAADSEALHSALAKLGEATGDAASASSAVTVTLDDETDPALLARLRAAVDTHRRVRLRYLVPGRDEVTEREVDPMRVVSMTGHWYLEGWCHRAQDVRLFRLSRILADQVLDVDGTPPDHVVGRDLDQLFTPTESDHVVTLRISPENGWVVDTYAAEVLGQDSPGSSESAADQSGWQRVRVRAADPSWVVGLALRGGGGIQVLEPVELADRIADQARRALRRYD
ncbi:MAG: helix-turn-helix transcriptional regulator [Actinomycetales bacterium]